MLDLYLEATIEGYNKSESTLIFRAGVSLGKLGWKIITINVSVINRRINRQCRNEVVTIFLLKR